MQVPSHVEYERATSVEHALALLGRPDHRVLAGGPSPIPLMKLRVAQPGVRVGDWSVAAAGALLRLDKHTIREAGIGLTAVAAEHFVAAEAEDFLRGKPATTQNFEKAAKIAAEHCHPVPDQRGPEDYKRHLVAELTTRALRRAAGRAAERTGKTA